MKFVTFDSSRWNLYNIVFRLDLVPLVKEITPYLVMTYSGNSIIFCKINLRFSQLLQELETSSFLCSVLRIRSIKCGFYNQLFRYHYIC
jgi:hypothetical protein